MGIQKQKSVLVHVFKVHSADFTNQGQLTIREELLNSSVKDGRIVQSCENIAMGFYTQPVRSGREDLGLQIWDPGLFCQSPSCFFATGSETKGWS